MAFELSKQERIKEIIRCGKNPVYFINNFVQITHALKGAIPFSLFPFQEQVVQDFVDHRFNIIVKARQLGMSTTAAAYIAWLILFHKDKSVLVLATKLGTAVNVVRKVKSILKNVPPWMLITKTIADNRNSVELDNGSWVKASSTSGDAGRSEALSLLVIDEAAHVENMDEIWGAIYPTVSCVAGNTLVLTEKGFIRIDDICKDRQVGEYFDLKEKVWGAEGLENTSHGYVSPESETLKITTKHGLKLEVTKKHPLLKLNSSGGEMLIASKLKLGDNLRIDFDMNVFGNDDSLNNEKYPVITKDLAYMVGGYIAEGWISGKTDGTKTTIWVSNGDDDFKNVYLNNQIVKPFTQDRTSIKIRCCSMELIKLLEDVGIEPWRKCYTKITPKKIFGCSKEIICNYLAGLFDGDGSVTSRGIVLSSTSERLIQETQLLLLNLGIPSNVHRVDAEKILKRERANPRLMPGGRPLQTLQDSWSLVIQNSYCSRFLEIIDLRIQRKKTRLLEYSKTVIQDEGKVETIPVKEIKETLDDIIWHSRKNYHWFRENGLRLDKALDRKWEMRNVNFNWLKKLHDILEKNDLLTLQSEEFFDKMIGMKCFWDPIVSIEESTAKTYDFTVPRTHTFLQNGIMGSNTGGSCIAISTPYGSDSWFHDTYTKAESGRNDFHPIKLPWNSHPERDQKWFEKETRNMSPRQIASEILCDFAMSGETLLQAADMQFIGKLVKDPKFKSGLDANLWVWEMPVSAAKYFLIADVARGDGTDFSVFHVFKTETMEQVAEYQGKIPGDQFSKLIASTAKDYNNAMVVVENNSYGFSVLEKLIEARVPNLYYSMKGSHEYVDAYRAEGAENVVPGFSTTNQTRPMVVAKLEEYIRNRMLLIYSQRAYGELKTFIWKNGKAQASKNKNDDLVMSAAIACFVRDTALNANKLDIEYQKAILMSHRVIATPFYATIPGQVNMSARDSYGNSVVDKRDYLQNDGSKAATQTNRIMMIPLPIYRG